MSHPCLLLYLSDQVENTLGHILSFLLFYFFLCLYSFLLSLQGNIFEYLIPVVLFNPQIALCDLIGRMVINIHQQGRRRSLPPGVVTEGLPQGMAAYIMAQTHGLGGLFNDPEGLTAAQRLICALTAGKQAGIFFRGG